jgi:hypothetical protein
VHERRAALARRAFAVELDNVASVAQQSTRKLVPFVYGVVVFGALLGIVAVARLTRRPTTALVRVTLAPASRPSALLSRSLFRGSVVPGLALALVRFALQRLATSPRVTMGPAMRALTAAASDAAATYQNGRNALVSPPRRGTARQA